jgi:transglutaminase-like putative cysteine protease
VRVLDAATARIATLRGFALLATAGLLASFTGVLYTFVDVAGDVEAFAVAVLGTLLVATVLARVLKPLYAILVVVALLVVSLAWYVLSLTYTPAVFAMIDSNVALLSGKSIHRIRQSGTWALAVAPAPVFATWYFALRRWYASAVLCGGSMLGYVVLTGDATLPVVLLGVVAGAAMLAFGDLDRHGGSIAGAEFVAIGLAVMVVVPLLISAVPTGAGSPVALGGGGGDGGGSQTLETTLLAEGDRFRIQGSIDLSPAVRFSVDSEIGRYWKARSFDRYTGDGWALTGGTTPLNRSELPFPPGARQLVTQRVAVESRLTTLPAAWRPISVGETVADNVSVTAEGDVTSDVPLTEGDAYWVTSAVRTASDASLATDGTEYPADISERYTQLPASTPDRVGERTAEIADGSETPYETAQAVESWLETNREYSLDVDRPDGTIADAFLFEMERGYCTYYATTMVTMLRSQGIPARLATGYTTGQQVDDGSYVVRGLDAHAWVEVYFPDSGWVSFDPTPAGPREAVEGERLEQARSANDPDVDTEESSAATETPTPTPIETDTGTNGTLTPVQRTPVEANESQFGSAGPDQPTVDAGPEGGLPDLPPREHLALGMVLLVGAAAGVRRSGLVSRLARSGRIRFQRRRDPATDVDVAFERMSILLERNHRSRETGETVRQYLEAIGAPEPAQRLAAIHERATYAGTVDRETADTAIGLVDDLRAAYAGGWVPWRRTP